MKGHEFAEFQKELFQKMKLEKRKRRVIFYVTVILTLLVLLSLPTLIRLITDPEYMSTFIPTF